MRLRIVAGLILLALAGCAGWRLEAVGRGHAAANARHRYAEGGLRLIQPF